ncbi:MAG TPA: hypothetical protein VFI28_13770 [Candidatus Limnocylindrales bacterium]|nr:hypothetical protein [Candidatus Limnocylindrales bacterium]
MPAQQIAENLAYINWTLLTGLAIGAFAAVLVARLRTSATRGFLAFTAACAVGFAVLAVLSDLGLPPRLTRPDAAVVDVPRLAALALFVVLAAGYVIVLARGRRAPVLGGAALVSGVATWFFAAAAWGGGFPGSVLLFVQLVVLGAATGGVFAAMILGHWYLVTPKLPEGPLVLISRLLLAVLVLQLGLFVAWSAVGAGAPGAETSGGFAVLVGPWALFAWLRLIVGLAFPIAVSWAAVQTARTRSMESATGLLYINVGTIAAGTILAAGLYFGAGILV